MKIVSYLFVTLTIPVLLMGQSTLHGVVADSSSGEKLVGVNVVILGSGLGTATSIYGEYRISGIPQRVVSVRVSCLGYEPKVKELDFSQYQDARLDVELAATVLVGEEVIVTAQRRGQLAAINQQLTSKTIVNVVSEEKIQELPDVNAAEAIGRLPGVALTRSGGEATGVVLRGLSSKFSTITLDGVKIPPTSADTRDVDLSMISQGALSGIELFKTLTPDKDADAIAGGINFVTRKASSDRLVRVDLKGNYNNLMRSANQYDAQARYGERFFDDLLGLQIQGNVERKIRSKEDYSIGYATSYNSSPDWQYPFVGGDTRFNNNYYNINSFTVQFTEEVRKRNGMQIILDYNTPDSGTVKLVGMLARTDRDITIHERVYLDWNYTYRNIVRSTGTRNIALEGENYVFGVNTDWMISFAESEVENPNDFQLQFNEPSGGFSLAPIQDHPEQLLGIAKNNFANSLLWYTTLRRSENYDKELTAKLDLSRNVPLGSWINNALKTGAKYRTKSRWLDKYGFAWNNYLPDYWRNADGTSDSADFSQYSFTNTTLQPLTAFYDPSNVRNRDLLGKYRMMPLVDPSRLDEWKAITKNLTLGQNILFGSLGLDPLDNYSVTEDITSGYIMNTMDFGQSLSLIYGVRMEHEKNRYLARYNVTGASGIGVVLSIPASDIIDTTAVFESVSWLPNLQMIFKPTEYLTFRAAAYKALARPDFNLRLPQYARSYSSTLNYIYLGNPKLQNASAWNYESSLQLHNNYTGLVTISGFYKRIENLFHEASNISMSWINDPTKLMGSIDRYPNFYLNGDDAYHRLDRFLEATGLDQWNQTPAFNSIVHQLGRFEVTAAYNSPEPSYTWGLELEHQMNFAFIPVKWMQNLVLSYNLTFMRSQTQVWMEKQVIDTSFTPAVYNSRGRKIQDSVFTEYANNEAQLVKKPMEDQPELFGNISLGYDIGGLSARLSMFYQARYTRSYSMSGQSDAIQDEFLKWDLSLKQELTSRIALTVNVNNIFNRAESRSRSNDLYAWGFLPTTGELYGTTMDFGVRVSL